MVRSACHFFQACMQMRMGPSAAGRNSPQPRLSARPDAVRMVLTRSHTRPYDVCRDVATLRRCEMTEPAMVDKAASALPYFADDCLLPYKT